MAIEVFNRYENKYLIDENKLAKLENRLSDYMELDAYNKNYETYSITNLYYDTDESSLIRTSLSKPLYKEKLRVRAYGVPDMDTKVYVEIKKKVAGLVNKRRSALELKDAYLFLGTGEVKEIKPYMNAQVLREIQYMLAQYALHPTLYLSYDRRAYYENEQYETRVSLDTNIYSRRTDLRLESGVYGERLLEQGKWLLEVKVKESIPFWLSRLLSEYEIYPTSFSKYGTEFKKIYGQSNNTKIFVYTQGWDEKKKAGVLMPSHS